ncbi:MAG: Rieske (2Fe-2S) protein [Gammaproteobacteria bacterium]|nr:Rieske (2Fe-2S) protein [Gammaproteobacteria bacterium]
MFSVSPFLVEQIDALVRFEIVGEHGGDIFCDLRDGVVSVKSTTKVEPSFSFHLPSSIAALVVAGRHTLEDVFPSMYLQIREPGGYYNFALTAILMYAEIPSVIKAVEDSFKNEATFNILCDGRMLEVQKYCPHAGQDLSGLTVENGRITCPRHGWVYDLRREGVCIEGGKGQLRVKPCVSAQKEVVLSSNRRTMCSYGLRSFGWQYPLALGSESYPVNR